MAARNDADDDRVLVITRGFDGPRELVFRAWTEEEQALAWWGPRGFTVPFHEFDFRVGGRYRACLRAPDGTDHWQTGVYKEISPPSRFVFTFAWEDEAGKLGHETLVTIELEEDAGKTTMTFRQATFKSKESRDGHQVGWSESIDRLAGHLETMAARG
jgi:uncharacterized protein YndB with AHSA1/START domain